MYMIAVGTRGIKPCVSTFGADHFEDKRSSVAKTMMHNVGWGPGLAIPLAGMVASLLLLLCGLPLYHHRPAQGSPLTRILQVMVAAVRHSRLPLPASDTYLFQGSPLDAPALPKLPHTDDFSCHGPKE
ncbi:hypothetical protein GOP47_0009567 [Adiantum capillus-veneris]|uniref:Uncharacterized protein n=1 Tax=Adiantum capillus-veneris TaxID=13818 RepID=A0A9D4ZJM2_ADICA|nr:hypothetical protein GOP47_0009567 [Adiantum capillus-veneris]